MFCSMIQNVSLPSLPFPSLNIFLSNLRYIYIHRLSTLTTSTDPKSLHGHLLLHRTTFSLGGHLPTTMTLLPRTPTQSSSSTLLPASLQTTPDSTPPTPPQQQQILLTTQTGTLSLLTPLTEPQYRRLSTLATHLTNTLYHPLGLNPRSFRAQDGSRSMMVDGSLVVGRWNELGSQRRADVAGRVGGIDVEEVREALGELGGGGLGFL